MLNLNNLAKGAGEALKHVLSSVAAIKAIRIRLMTELCKAMKGTGEEEGRGRGGVKTAARGSASGANTFHLTCFCC